MSRLGRDMHVARKLRARGWIRQTKRHVVIWSSARGAQHFGGAGGAVDGLSARDDAQRKVEASPGIGRHQALVAPLTSSCRDAREPLAHQIDAVARKHGPQHGYSWACAQGCRHCDEPPMYFSPAVAEATQSQGVVGVPDHFMMHPSVGVAMRVGGRGAAGPKKRGGRRGIVDANREAVLRGTRWPICTHRICAAACVHEPRRGERRR